MFDEWIGDLLELELKWESTEKVHDACQGHRRWHGSAPFRGVGAHVDSDFPAKPWAHGPRTAFEQVG